MAARRRGAKAVTVKLDPELYQTVSDVSALTGVTIKDLFERALQREVRSHLRDDRLRGTLDTIREFRAAPA